MISMEYQRSNFRGQNFIKTFHIKTFMEFMRLAIVKFVSYLLKIEII